jgi:hypothetical protein
MAKCSLAICHHLLLAFLAGVPQAQMDRGGELSARQHLQGQRLPNEDMARIVTKR